VGGLTAHGLCIRTGWLRALARPIDGGRTWRGVPIFGANKTWRGVVAVGLGAMLWASVQPALPNPAADGVDYRGWSGAALAFALGAAAMLAELPNSFLKRRLGIAPGAPASGGREAAFWLLDQVDLLVGASLAVGWVFRPTPSRVLLSIVLFALVHQLISAIGFRLGMRRTAR
jgi:CDP-2,3-bis-(O-geranylgeranyl)-sn-glycerol synthase